MNYKQYKLSFFDDLIKFILNHDKLTKSYDFSFKTQKYDLSVILSEIFYFCKSGISYNDYRGPINCKTLNWHINKLSNSNIFEEYYIHCLNRYFKSNKTGKLKYNYTDTCFIPNKNGVELTGRNKYYKSKKGTKISLLTDQNNITFSLAIKAGNKNDAEIIIDNLNNLYINTQANDLKNSNKHKQYLLADKGYDSYKVRNEVNSKGYIPIIDYNKRNTKDPKKIKYLTKKEKKIYKKRSNIERLFSLLKGSNKRLIVRLEKKFITFKSIILIALIKHLHISSIIS